MTRKVTGSQTCTEVAAFRGRVCFVAIARFGLV